MMNHSVPRNRISKEQYSIPGRKSIDHALNRRLLFDISRYQKSSLAMTSCDLQSCYNRVAHTPALLAMLGYGIPSEPMYSMFHAIQYMKFTTRTVFRDSGETFGGREPTFTCRPQGLGQGNGMGPQIWAVVSSRMFEVLHKKRGLETSFMTLMLKEVLKLCGFTFVDDSDIVAEAEGRNNPIVTLNSMQKTINCWEGVAKSTGGALAPSKSWWYLTHYVWDNNGNWEYGEDTSKMEVNNLTARDKNNSRIDLEYSSSSSKKMLGVYLAPDSNNDKKQVEIMKERASKIAELAWAGHIKKTEAWVVLTTMAMKSLEYSLPAPTLTENECNKIMWQLLNKILPKSGINRNIKKEVL